MREQFLDLYTGHYTQMVRFVMLARHATRAEAEDAAQDAFLEAWRTVHRPGHWQKISSPEAWIRTIALRRHDRPAGIRRQPPAVLGAEDLLAAMPHPAPDPADLATQTVDVLGALHTVEDPDARAVMAFTLDGFSDQIIADHLGTDTQRVRNLRKKVRTQLARTLARTRAQEGDTAR